MSFQKTAVVVLASVVVFLKTAVAVLASVVVFLKTAVAVIRSITNLHAIQNNKQAL